MSRRTFVGSLTVAASAGLAGCGGFGGGNGNGEPTGNDTDDEPSPTETEAETEEPATQAAVQVRAVHAVVGGPEVDVYVGDEPAFEGVAYKDVSDYANVEADATEVRVTAAGEEDQVLYEDELDVDDEGTFSVVAYGDAGGLFAGGEETPTGDEDMQQNDSDGQGNESSAQQNGTATGTPDGASSQGALQIALLEDDVAEVEGEDAAVRVFHASPDAPEVDVAVAGEEEPLVSALGYGETSEYATVASGSQTLEVRAAGESDAVAEFEAELEAGRGHTGYAVGYLESDDPEAETAFDLVGVVDGTADAADAGGTAGAGNGSSTNESAAGNDSSAGSENETSTA